MSTVHGQTCNQNSKDGITNKTKNARGIKVPKIYWDLTRKAVLTMEWLDGIKLTNCPEEDMSEPKGTD